MALYDSADLLARTKRLARRPGTDEDITDPIWYEKLAEAQVQWMGELAALVPEPNYSAPEQLTSPDGGFTYTLAAEPLGGHLELRATRGGLVLLPGTDWGDGDFVLEGQIIRIPGGRSRSFPNGPWARYVKAPGVLDATNQPVMKPAFARLLLPPTACYLFALEGGIRDPGHYEKLMQERWSGNPNLPGTGGILQTLKTQFFAAGQAAVVSANLPWWRNNPDLTP
jgi:hypothetical protein